MYCWTRRKELRQRCERSSQLFVFGLEVRWPHHFRNSSFDRCWRVSQQSLPERRKMHQLQRKLQLPMCCWLRGKELRQRWGLPTVFQPSRFHAVLVLMLVGFPVSQMWTSVSRSLARTEDSAPTTGEVIPAHVHLVSMDRTVRQVKCSPGLHIFFFGGGAEKSIGSLTDEGQRPERHIYLLLVCLLFFLWSAVVSSWAVSNLVLFCPQISTNATNIHVKMAESAPIRREATLAHVPKATRARTARKVLCWNG